MYKKGCVRNGNRRNAYFTVEAALILPMVMSAMMMGIYMFSYLYDRCLLEQDAGRLMLQSSSLLMETHMETEEIEGRIRSLAADINKEKYAAWEFGEISIKLEENRLSVTGQGSLAFPLPGWNLWNDDNLWDARADFCSHRLSPVFYIRQYRKLQDLF